MVYHYSDGVLEYEEHFSSSNVLQELLKYSYDADGNVEYLLYKDNNFSNANAFDLYYYVRDAVGNITDLFQVREQNGSSTTVVNRIAAHYEYDPYGNILSIDKYNNDPIGDINPIRYKDYYYDLQTGWYQTESRFYDPEVGRFLNADDLSLLMATDSGVIDKNLYAYCDGNPVMRKDEEGDYWQFITGTIGALIGAGFEAASQISEYGEIKDVKQIIVAGATGALCGAFPTFAIYIATIGTFAQEMVAFDAEYTPSYIINASVDSIVAGMTTKLLSKPADLVIENIKKLTSPKLIPHSKVSSKANAGSGLKRPGAIFGYSNAYLHLALFGGAISFAFHNWKRWLLNN